MKVALKDIKSNPYRDLTKFPVSRVKVAQLVESIQTTGFWPNIVARRNSDGEIELAYGHTRLAALREVYPASHEIDVILEKRTNGEMLQIMVRENMNDSYRTNVSVLFEGLPALVEALAKGEVEIEIPKDTRKDQLRYAPSFRKEVPTATVAVGHPYTMKSIAHFLGAVDRDGQASETARAVMGALELIECKMLTYAAVIDQGTRELVKLVRDVVVRHNEMLERNAIAAKALAQVAEDAAKRKQEMEKDEAKLKAAVEAKAVKLRAAEAEENAKKIAQQQKDLVVAKEREAERQKTFKAERAKLDAKIASQKRDEEDARRAREIATRKDIAKIVKPEPREYNEPVERKFNDDDALRHWKRAETEVDLAFEVLSKLRADDLLKLKRVKTIVEGINKKAIRALNKLEKV